MKPSICHYSFHRTWKEKKWDCVDLAKAVKALGVGAVDFHAGLTGSTDGAAQRIKTALQQTGLVLSGLSLSNNLNQEDPAELKAQIAKTVEWIRVAAEVKAPISRIFGGSLLREQRADPRVKEKKLELIVNALGEIVKEAEKLGITLALENHGGLPCTGEEQVKVIKTVNSPRLRATVDVGNYLGCGQEGHAGTALAAPYAAYVHFKDFKKIPDASDPRGWTLEACAVGSGDVNLKKCMDAFKAAKYNGFVALEYEGVEGEEKGVPQSVKFMKDIFKAYS